MFNSVMALLGTKICIRSPGHDSRDTIVVAKVSSQHPHVTAGLAPLWSAIEAWTPELERRAEGWFEMSGATALDDVVEYELMEAFLDHLELKQVLRLKASEYLQARMRCDLHASTCCREKDSSQSPSEPRSEQVARLDHKDLVATEASQEAEYKKQSLLLARPGMQPTAGRSRSMFRQDRSSRRSDSTGCRVSFSADTKGSSGCPGDWNSWWHNWQPPRIIC